MLKPKTSVQNQRALHYKRFTQIEKSDSLSTLYKTIYDDKFWKFDFNNQEFIEIENTFVTKNTKIILITDVSVIKNQDAYFKYINGSWEFVGGTTYYSSYNDWTPGLYDDNDNLVKTWEQLVEEDYFYIEDGYVKAGSNIENLTGKLVLTHDVNSAFAKVFQNCKLPLFLVVPDNYTYIKLQNCEGLKKVILGKNVTTSFENCINLELAYLNAEEEGSDFYNAGTNANGLSVIYGSNVQLCINSFGNEYNTKPAANLISIVFEENSKLWNFQNSIMNCKNFKYLFLPNVVYRGGRQFSGAFVETPSNFTIYCGFSEEQANYYINNRIFEKNWNYANQKVDGLNFTEGTQVKTIYNYNPVYTLDKIYNGNIAKYQINKYFFVDSFDYMIKGSIDRYESQPIKGLITPSESFQIRTFDDDIDLDHDDIVVIDGGLYAIESVELVQKRVPKKFNIYFATVRSIL